MSFVTGISTWGCRVFKLMGVRRLGGSRNGRPSLTETKNSRDMIEEDVPYPRESQQRVNTRGDWQSSFDE
jgi:hypothetical protein